MLQIVTSEYKMETANKIQKIKILSLEKTEEYILREVEVLKARRRKLLQDSDWTQLPDVSLSTKVLQKWTRYRKAVRDMEITPDNLDESKAMLTLLANKVNA